MCKFECQLNEILPYNLIKLTFAKFSIIQNRFINYIPSVYSTFISYCHGIYRRTHTPDQYILTHIMTVCISEKPCWCLSVPTQRVSHSMHSILVAAVDKFIRTFEGNNTFLRLRLFAFDPMLRDDKV